MSVILIMLITMTMIEDNSVWSADTTTNNFLRKNEGEQYVYSSNA